jgi:hypothetical protein
MPHRAGEVQVQVSLGELVEWARHLHILPYPRLNLAPASRVVDEREGTSPGHAAKLGSDATERELKKIAAGVVPAG